MIHLTREGTVVSASERDLERLRRKFDRAHCIRLPSFLKPGLLRAIQLQMDHAAFKRRIHKGIGVELCMTMDNAVFRLLHFLMHDPRLFEIIRRITGCGRIGCFVGRVYRFVPGARHYDSWHSDVIYHRMIAVSTNLGRGIYTGGIFQMRKAHSLRIIHEAANTGPGDAIIFRISPGLRHRVTTVEGSVPKTAFAGWFCSRPDFYAFLKKSKQPLKKSKRRT